MRAPRRRRPSHGIRRRGRALALERIAITAEQDATLCDDEALDQHEPDRAETVRQALRELARQLRSRAAKLTR